MVNSVRKESRHTKYPSCMSCTSTRGQPQQSSAVRIGPAKQTVTHIAARQDGRAREGEGHPGCACGAPTSSTLQGTWNIVLYTRSRLGSEAAAPARRRRPLLSTPSPVISRHSCRASEGVSSNSGTAQPPSHHQMAKRPLLVAYLQLQLPWLQEHGGGTPCDKRNAVTLLGVL